MDANHVSSSISFPGNGHVTVIAFELVRIPPRRVHPIISERFQESFHRTCKHRRYVLQAQIEPKSPRVKNKMNSACEVRTSSRVRLTHPESLLFRNRCCFVFSRVLIHTLTRLHTHSHAFSCTYSLAWRVAVKSRHASCHTCQK